MQVNVRLFRDDKGPRLSKKNGHQLERKLRTKRSKMTNLLRHRNMLAKDIF